MIPKHLRYAITSLMGNGQIEARSIRFRCPTCGHTSAYLSHGNSLKLIAKCFHPTCSATSIDLLIALGIQTSDKLDDEEWAALLGIFPRASKFTSVAPIPVLDTFYQAFLSRLTLSAEDASYLKSRGFEGDSLSEYRSFYPTSSPAVIVKSRLAELPHWDSIPGFYHDVEGRASIAYLPRSILIPMRTLQGKIFGIKVRSTLSDSKVRYRYMSSVSYGGPKAISDLHYPLNQFTSGTLYITEGELKANYLSQCGYRAVSIPGVSFLSNTDTVDRRSNVLNAVSPYAKVILCLDNDAAGRLATRKILDRLTPLLSEKALYVAVWDAKAKGIDDAIEALLPVTLHPIRMDNVGTWLALIGSTFTR
jgi:hypothetical protein